MNKRLHFCTYLLLVCSMGLSAKQVSTNDAMSVANAQMASQSNLKRGNTSLQLVYTARDTTSLLKSTNSTPYFYVFNKADNSGFVMVSAQDNYAPVIAYSNEMAFDAQNLPQGLKELVQTVEKEIASSVKLKTTASLQVATQWQAYLSGNINSLKITNAVAPLIKTKWNDRAPYNKYAYYDPEVPSFINNAGYTAVAMASILNYHKYPTKGHRETEAYNYNIVSPPYQSIYLPSVDITKTEYNWDTMRDEYSTSSAESEIDQIATLMLHCGLALKQQYKGKYGITFPPYTSFAKTFVKFYGYSSFIREISTTNNPTYAQQIKDNINQSLPVMYTSGVIDGYDDQGLFHFNSAGGAYYSINLPTFATINIKPRSAEEKPDYKLIENITTNKSVVVFDEQFWLSSALKDFSPYAFDEASLRYALYDVADNFLGLLDTRLSIPRSFGLGTFKVKAVDRFSPDKYTLLPTVDGVINEIRITVKDITDGDFRVVKSLELTDTNLTRGGRITVAVEIHDQSASKFADRPYELGLYQGGQLKGILESVNSKYLQTYGKNQGIVPTSIEPGNYVLQAIMQDYTGNWQVVPQKDGMTNAVNVVVDSILFYETGLKKLDPGIWHSPNNINDPYPTDPNTFYYIVEDKINAGITIQANDTADFEGQFAFAISSKNISYDIRSVNEMDILYTSQTISIPRGQEYVVGGVNREDYIQTDRIPYRKWNANNYYVYALVRKTGGEWKISSTNDAFILDPSLTHLEKPLTLIGIEPNAKGEFIIDKQTPFKVSTNVYVSTLFPDTVFNTNIRLMDMYSNMLEPIISNTLTSTIRENQYTFDCEIPASWPAGKISVISFTNDRVNTSSVANGYYSYINVTVTDKVHTHNLQLTSNLGTSATSFTKSAKSISSAEQVQTKFANNGLRNFSGSVGIALIREGIITIIAEETGKNLPVGAEDVVTFDCEIPSNIQGGEYQLMMVAKSDGEAWQEVEGASPEVVAFVPFSVNVVTGIDEVNDKQLSIYPNPVKDVLTIETSENILSAELYDAQGKLCTKTLNSDNSIFVNDLAKGLYILQLKTDKGTYIRKVQKN